MSILTFVDRISVQTAIYWGSPVNDGYGGFTYGDPIEIKCRWEDKIKIINNAKGEEEISNTAVLTNEDLDSNGILYLGTLEDLIDLVDNSDNYIDLASGQVYPYPNQIVGARKIVAKDKVPLIRSTTQFVKIYYLKPNWETKL